ncbi:MAG: PEP-CTERM sorting domain-containing protein [Stellaceae bacterium]
MGLVSGGANAATFIGSFPVTASAFTFSPLEGPCASPAGSVWPSAPPSRDGNVGGILNNTAQTSCGPIAFNAPINGTLVMTVQPGVGQFAGDVYQAFVDGTSLGLTTPVPLFGTAFSTGTFTTPISAGAHNFDINDQIISYIGFVGPYGSVFPPPNNTVPASFSPSSLTVTLEELPAAVPEPSSLALFGAWLAGIAFYWRRRKLG